MARRRRAGAGLARVIARRKKKYFWVTDVILNNALAAGAQANFDVVIPADWAIVIGRETIKLERIIMKIQMHQNAPAASVNTTLMAIAIIHEDAVMGNLNIESAWDNELMLYHGVEGMVQDGATPQVSANGRVSKSWTIDLRPGRTIANNQEVQLGFFPLSQPVTFTAITRALLSK